MKVKLGRYRHFKGGVYEVIGEGKHSETLEEMVIYKNGEGQIWIRPKSMFLEEVPVLNDTGRRVKRFEFLGDR